MFDSVFVYDVDKMELLLQMMEYEKWVGGKEKLDFSEFVYVVMKLVLFEMKKWVEELFVGYVGVKEVD